MRIDIRELIQLSKFQMDTNVVGQLLGEDALLAYQSYQAKLKSLNKPTLEQFGLAHHQLRGVKADIKDERQKQYDARKAEYDAAVMALNTSYATLLSNVATAKNLLDQFQTSLRAAQNELTSGIDSLSKNYAIQQGQPLQCDIQLEEKEYYDWYRVHQANAVELKAVNDMLHQLGVQDTSLVEESYDDYGYEAYIRINGKHFDLKLTQQCAGDDRNIVCTIEMPEGYSVIGGDQAKLIRSGYAKAIADWVGKNQYVLALELDSEFVQPTDVEA